MAKDDFYDSYDPIKLSQGGKGQNFKNDRWGSLRQMYRELDPDVTYQTFYNRIRKGWDPMQAAVTPRDPRGRRGRPPQST